MIQLKLCKNTSFLLTNALLILSVFFLDSASATAMQNPRGSAGPVTARSIASPSIRGRVLDSLTKRPIQGASVKLFTQTGIKLIDSVTDTSGNFQFVELTTITYILEIDVDGFQSVRRRHDLTNRGPRAVIMDIVMLKRLPGTNTLGISPSSISVEDMRIPSEARKAFDKGVQELHEKKKPARSIKHFRKAVKLYPEYEKAHEQLGMAHLQKNEYNKAREILEKAVAFNPETSHAYAPLALVYKQLGLSEEMTGALREALRVDPNDYGSNAETAQQFLQTGQLADAEQHARKAHDLNKEEPSIHLLLFNIAVQKNDLELAETELNEFLELFPKHAAAPQVREKLKQVKQLRAETSN